MYSEDRVLVAVVQRRKDLRLALTRAWYRVPEARMNAELPADYLALYLSQAAARGLGPGGIYYYARLTGFELARRCDLLPDEAQHPRAHALYYQLQFKAMTLRKPPVLNPARRPISFIHTTWDRFIQALIVDELYSKADLFVDRVYYARPRPTTTPSRWSAKHFAFANTDLSYAAQEQKAALLYDLDS